MRIKLIAIIIIILSFSGNEVFAESTIKVSITGKGQALVFIPALGCSGEMWNKTVEHFSKSHKCYTVSINGFAGQAITENQNFEQIKTDISNYLIDHNIKKAILIGHSFGGALSLEIAASNPSLFSKMIVVDAYSFPLDVFVPGITIEQAQEQSNTLSTNLLSLSNEAFRAHTKTQLANAVTDKNHLSRILNWQLSSDRSFFVEAMGRTLSMDHRADLLKIKIPTLIIGTWVAYAPYGFTKESTKQAFQNQYKNLKFCKVVMAESGKHFIMYDETDWFNQQLNLFLQ